MFQIGTLAYFASHSSMMGSNNTRNQQVQVFMQIMCLCSFTFFCDSVKAVVSCSQATAQNVQSPDFGSDHLFERFWAIGFLGEKTMYLSRFLKYQKGGKEQVTEWGSYNSPTDPSGDFRQSAKYLPPSLKFLFSLKTLDNSLNEADPLSPNVAFVQVPSVKAVVKGLGLLSREMSEVESQNFLTYYEADHIVSGIIYLQNLSQRNALPMGTKGNLFEHDFNFHFTSGLVMPPQLVRALRTRAELLLLLLEKSKTHWTDPRTAENISRSIEGSILRRAVSALDLTGNLWGDFNGIYPDSNLAKSLDQILLGSTNAKQFLDSCLKWASFFRGDRDQFYEFYKSFEASIDGRFLEEDIPATWFSNSEVVHSEFKAQLLKLEALAKKVRK